MAAKTIFEFSTAVPFKVDPPVQTQLNTEIEKSKQLFEKEKSELIERTKLEVSDELNKMTEEFEKLTLKHQKKCLDFDRLEQTYENLKKELHYTRQQKSNSMDNLNSQNTNQDDSAINSTTLNINEDGESSSDDDSDDDLDMPKPAKPSTSVNIESDFNASGSNIPNRQASTVSKEEIERHQKDLAELKTKNANLEKLVDTYRKDTDRIHAELAEANKPKITYSKFCMTDPMITDSEIEIDKSNEQKASDFYQLEKKDLCEILAKTINCNRMLETDNDQIQSNFDYELKDKDKEIMRLQTLTEDSEIMEKKLQEVLDDKFALQDQLERANELVAEMEDKLKNIAQNQNLAPGQAMAGPAQMQQATSGGRQTHTRQRSRGLTASSNSQSNKSMAAGILSYLTGGSTTDTAAAGDNNNRYSTSNLNQDSQTSNTTNFEMNSDLTNNNLSFLSEQADVIAHKRNNANKKKQAMLQYTVANTVKVVKCLIADMDPIKVQNALAGTPVYAFFMALRYADHMNNEIMVKQLLSSSLQQAKRVIRKNSENVAMLSFWLANISKLLSLFKQYSGEEEFSKRNTVEQNQHCLLNFDLCEFREVFSNMAISAYQRLIQATTRALKPLIVPAMLEEDTIQSGGSSRSGSNRPNLDQEITEMDLSDYTALEKLLLQMSKWHHMFAKHGMDQKLIKQFFNQIFYFITSTTLNTQLVRKELCNWTKAMQIRYNTSQLEEWLRRENLESASIGWGLTEL